jgi:hypothetical protein
MNPRSRENEATNLCVEAILWLVRVLPRDPEVGAGVVARLTSARSREPRIRIGVRARLVRNLPNERDRDTESAVLRRGEMAAGGDELVGEGRRSVPVAPRASGPLRIPTHLIPADVAHDRRGHGRRPHAQWG